MTKVDCLLSHILWKFVGANPSILARNNNLNSKGLSIKSKESLRPIQLAIRLAFSDVIKSESISSILKCESGGKKAGEFGREFEREFEREFGREFGREFEREFGREFERLLGRLLLLIL